MPAQSFPISSNWVSHPPMCSFLFVTPRHFSTCRVPHTPSLYPSLSLSHAPWYQLLNWARQQNKWWSSLQVAFPPEDGEDIIAISHAHRAKSPLRMCKTEQKPHLRKAIPFVKIMLDYEACFFDWKMVYTIIWLLIWILIFYIYYPTNSCLLICDEVLNTSSIENESHFLKIVITMQGSQIREYYSGGVTYWKYI